MTETDSDTSLADYYCLICGSSPVNESSDDYDEDKILEIFLSCVDLTENFNELSEHTTDIKFCLKCKRKLGKLDYVQIQIDRLLLRSKQLRMSIITEAVQQSSVPSENSSARWIRRLIRNKFQPVVLLKKCDSEKQKITRARPRKSSPVARKRPTAHSLRVSADPKGIQKPQDIESRIATEDLDAASLHDIKFEQFDSKEMGDYEMRDPLELNGDRVAPGDSSLILKNEGDDTEADETPGRTLNQPILSDTTVSTVTASHKPANDADKVCIPFTKRQKTADPAPQTRDATYGTNESKQYPCTFQHCTESFRNRGDIKRHISYKHRTEVCPNCRKLQRKKYLRAHLTKCGTPSSRFLNAKYCKDCNLTFTSSRLKYDHIRNDLAHGTPCVRCQRIVKKRNLKTHRCGI